MNRQLPADDGDDDDDDNDDDDNDDAVSRNRQIKQSRRLVFSLASFSSKIFLD